MSAARPPIPVGKIVRAHGLRGEVHVALYGDGDVVEEAEVVLLGPAGTRRRVVAFRRGNEARRAVLHLEGVGDRNAAEALRGQEIALPADAFPPADAGEYWHHELVGREVVDRSEAGAGRVIGRIVEILNYGASDLLVVHGEAGEWLVPVLDDVVLSMAGVQVEVAIPEGLEPGPVAGAAKEPVRGERAKGRGGE